MQKKAMVSDIGKWVNNKWEWDFKRRRNLRPCEQEWLSELLGMVNKIPLNSELGHLEVETFEQ